jgi:hypothetical protein
MFLPSWTLVGRLDELDAAGSYITLDISWAGPRPDRDSHAMKKT